MATPKRPSNRSKSRATAASARKTAPKSGANARTWAAADAEPKAPAKTALAAKAEATTPSLRPGRRRSVGRSLAAGGLLAAVVVVIVLIATGGDNNNTTVADTAPAATTPTATSPTVTAPAAAPAARPAVRAKKCDPIIGSGTANSGKTYDVTSAARDGDPADCGEAHSVLLSALSGGGTAVGDWRCKTDPSGATIATCTSTGGRKIAARG